MLIEDNAVVLFQGDSITECGRSREDQNDLGRGYAFMSAALFSSMHPARNVQFINRGISGNTVEDLKSRWQDDCIALKPTWLSILVGINDSARAFTQNKPMSAEVFESTYRDLLTQAKATCGARLILMEPFVLPIPEDRIRWREDLDAKVHAVRRLAREFDAILIPLDGLFAQAACRPNMAYWAPDGVHPTPAGHALIARHWLKSVKAL